MPSLVPLAQIFATYSPTRTEADVQQNIASFLTLSNLGLSEGQVARVEEQTGDGTRRRLDITYGRLIIEVKKDLRIKGIISKAETQLGGYLKTLHAATQDDYAGIISDGVSWRLYARTGDMLTLVEEHCVQTVDNDALERLAGWLVAILLTGPKQKPTPRRIEERLGAESPRYKFDRLRLAALHAEHKNKPEVKLKRELWARLLRTALGANFQDDENLFLDHTLLVIEAEIIAHLVVGLDDLSTMSLQQLLSGERFRKSGIVGVVEADFFDWPSQVEGGDAIIGDFVRELTQFDWSDVEHDVLKHLYEAIIGAETRHHLGEYYTPDWLAQRIVEETVDDPLNQRTLDPACGSGTFVFHAIRRFLNAADAAGMTNADALEQLQHMVYGMDIHPVSVVLARVTYLLAITPTRLQLERGTLSIPVFLGDSVQWGRGTETLTSDIVTIEVAGEDLLGLNTEAGTLAGIDEVLEFPFVGGKNPAALDMLISDLAEAASGYDDETKTTPFPPVTPILNKHKITDQAQVNRLRTTFHKLCELNAEGRDHIWGYFARNQLRPAWLTRHKVDVLVGNPPWVAQRYMTASMQKQFKLMSETRGIWTGGKFTTQQDLVALFVARSVELFLKRKGKFAYVVPHAVLSRQQHEGLRTGVWLQAESNPTSVAFGTAWDLAKVKPDPFPMPSGVVFGVRKKHRASPLPSTNVRFSGSPTNLKELPGFVEQLTSNDAFASPYHQHAIQGATIVPRVLTFVQELPPSVIGRAAGTTDVRSSRSALEDKAWKHVPDVISTVEQEFVHSVLQGSDIAPHIVLGAQKAVLPATEAGMVPQSKIGDHPLLSERWNTLTRIWDANKAKAATNKMTLLQRLDYQGGLAAQFPTAAHRLVYTKSGTRLTATYVDDSTLVIDNQLYWLRVASEDEGRYLAAILNSLPVLERVGNKQALGAWGERHFHRLPLRLPIPRYDADTPAHVDLAALGRRAADVAAAVAIPVGTGFQKGRQLIRVALDANGVASDVDTAVLKLLGG